MITRKFHYFYKIINNINGHFYYGVHNTDNLDDGYMGSGKRLSYAYKKYGIENFSKEILKFFDSASEAFKYEAEIVTESLVKQNECYNIQCGGRTFNTTGLVPVKDKNGNTFLVSKNDKKYISGEYVSTSAGMVTVFDKEGKFYRVSVNDPRYLNGELIHVFATSSFKKNEITVKDKSGKFYRVSVNDPRYLNGELISIWTGRKHKKETIHKMKESMSKHNHQQGEKNSQYGKCWIYNEDKQVSTRIYKDELLKYIQLGWKKGRKMKF